MRHQKTLILILIPLIFCIVTIVRGQSIDKTKSEYENLSRSLEKAIEAENTAFSRLSARKNQIKTYSETSLTELNTLRLQFSTLSNLMSFSAVSLEDLKKAQKTLRKSKTSALNRFNKLQEEDSDLQMEIKSTADQLMLNKTQLKNLRSRKVRIPIIRTLIKQLTKITRLLEKKEKQLKNLQRQYHQLANNWKQALDQCSILLDKVKIRIDEKEKEELFRRKQNPLASLNLNDIKKEMIALTFLVIKLARPGFWVNQAQILWKTGSVKLITSLTLFFILEGLLFRFRLFWRKRLQERIKKEASWWYYAVTVFSRSILLLGATLFVYIYANVHQSYEANKLIELTAKLLILWLFTAWVNDFLTLKNWGQETSLERYTPKRLYFLVIAIRWSLILYIVLQELLGQSSSLLLVYRLFLEIIFIGWNLFFWSRCRKQITSETLTKFSWMKIGMHTTTGLAYLVAGGGFILELAGYSSLATLWYAGCGRGIVVVLWSTVFFMILRETETTWETAATFNPAATKDTRKSIEWLSIRLLWVVWILLTIIALMLALGAKLALIAVFFRVLNAPIPIGSLKFRLAGLIYALIILAITHVASRWLSHIIKERILLHSGLELGLKESITTICVYVAWLLGILGALNALGFSTTSLTVAFGALGIGLGFGLQNIFNNFISGLILLFERPVQVGDFLEVNGIWGTVAKINVRSTIVQTRDNASIIIPNSEFISSKVTNWSFKDLRIRRNIDIGVSYSSDIELVRDTLLQIARKHPNVLKKPEPNVVFLDFGDSALLFRLRVWTTVMQRIQVETDIRFEINRIFKELQIEIPFPQRDLHIYSPSPSTPVKTE